MKSNKIGRRRSSDNKNNEILLSKYSSSFLGKVSEDEYGNDDVVDEGCVLSSRSKELVFII